MVRVAEDENRVFDQSVHREAIVRLAGYEEREGPVDFASTKVSNQRIVGSLHDRERETGSVSGEAFDRTWQQAGESGRHAHTRMSPDSISKRLQLVEGLLPVSKDESRVPLEQRAIDRRVDSLAASCEELHAERPLQSAHPTAERRLGHASLLGRAEDASVLEDGEELFEIADIHVYEYATMAYRIPTRFPVRAVSVEAPPALVYLSWVIGPTLPEIRTALAARPARPILGERLMRHAAVAAVLRDSDTGPELLLIRRAERRGDPWSGDMAFPGGLVSASDLGPYEAALRETSEELGLDLGRDARPIGELSHVLSVAHLRPLPMAIVPFVFELTGAPALRTGPEVQESLWVPLARFADPRRREQFVRALLGIPLRFECCRYADRTVWGLTLRMIDDLLAALGPRSDPMNRPT